MRQCKSKSSVRYGPSKLQEHSLGNPNILVWPYFKPNAQYELIHRLRILAHERQTTHWLSQAHPKIGNWNMIEKLI